MTHLDEQIIIFEIGSGAGIVLDGRDTAVRKANDFWSQCSFPKSF